MIESCRGLAWFNLVVVVLNLIVARPGMFAAQPQSRPASAPVGILVVHFPEGEDEVSLKVERAMGLLFVRDVRINGESIGLAEIDTGVDCTIISRKVADRLKLRSRRIDGLRQEENALRQTESLSMGGVSVGGLEVVTADVDKLFHLKEPVDAIIGADVLGTMPFAIDCRAAAVVLYEPRHFKPPQEARGFDLTILRSSVPAVGRPLGHANVGLPLVPCRIDGIACMAMLDTGQSRSLSVFPALIRAHPELLGRCPDPVTMPEMLSSYGRAFRVRPREIELLEHRFGSPREAQAYEDRLPSMNARESVLDGVPTDSAVGMPVLEDFYITFDLAGRHVWTRWQPPRSVAEQLAAGMDPNGRDLTNEPPLMRAARAGDVAGVRALIDAGATVDAEDSRGNTALRYAVEHGGVEVVRLLLREPAKAGVNSTTVLGETPLMAAAEMASSEVVQMLLAAGADPTLKDRVKATALHHAAIHGNVGAIEILCKAGLDVDAYCTPELTPLALAAGHGSIEAFDALIKAGAKPNLWLDKHATLLHAAAFSGNAELVRHVMRDLPVKFDVNGRTFEDYTPLVTAAEFGNARTVEMLLDAGADVGQATNVGLRGTALHLASMNGHVGVVRLLLKAHAPIEARCLLGRTPLILAVIGNQREMVTMLLAAGAKLEARDDAGGTALMGAAATGHVEVLRVLLKAGASVNSVATDSGATALHLAASRGHAEIIPVLFEAGADPGVKAKDGGTAAEWARRRGLESIAHILEAWGTAR